MENVYMKIPMVIPNLVVTILDKTQLKEKEKSQPLKKRVGPRNAKRIVISFPNVGTIMHNILEHWVKNEEYPETVSCKQR